MTPPSPQLTARAIVAAILQDLGDRRGIKHLFNDLREEDPEVWGELVGTLEGLTLQQLAPGAVMPDAVHPITPRQAAANTSATHLPDFVVAAANQLIAEGLDGGRVRFTLNALRERIARLQPDRDATELDREAIEKKWYDIESYYGKNGWSVEYDQPGYNENHYEPFFIFKAKKK